MAGSVLIGLSSKVLSAIASPAFHKAYEKGVSIWEAKDELHKLKVTIETLQAMVIDAEKRQESSAAVKNWVQRLKGVFYDAEDLFDEFATEDLLKQQMMEEKNKLPLKNKVRVYCSKLNPIVSRNSIATNVKAIRERLVDISVDMAQFGFVPNHAIELEPMLNMRGERYAARCSPDAKYVVGRDEDKKVILEMLFKELSDTPVVISIEGIGGMGKTTLTHLIYNDEKVSTVFEKRWFACISNTTDEREVFGKIYQSVSGSGYSDLTMFQLQEKVREFITGKNYLLVLDDVWEDHHGRWVNKLSLLSSGAKGSRIVVTTRLPSVGIAMGAVKAHSLGGLTDTDSWDLFKSLSFASGYENDPRRETVGKNLLERCRGVPLAIWCMGSLLHNKTIQEWEEFERVDFPTLGGQYNDEIMSILKLSYDNLSSNFKHCFVYCCLFPKDYKYEKNELIYHWIAQGYINEDEGETSFMHLLRMGFFQEMKNNEFGEINSCKMHDLMHDLALYLGGEETIMLGVASSSTSSCTRHVSLGEYADEIPTSLFNVMALRSCLLGGSNLCEVNLNQLCTSFKLLRTLTLRNLGIEYIPDSIGELKLVRYLDLSWNKFEKLPDSIANLVNLLVLDIRWCYDLKVLSHNFKKLTKLWSLSNEYCYKLRLMPEGFGELARLQHLSDFKVTKGSEVDVLNGLLKQLRGNLVVRFCEEMEDQDGLNLELPSDLSLQRLKISLYPGQRIRGRENNNCSCKLERLRLRNCKNVKYLPHLSCLPILKSLELVSLEELEFMEEEEEGEANVASNKLFFPCLENLKLLKMPKLKGFRRGKVMAEATFSRLLELEIKACPNLMSFPHCPSLRVFDLEYENADSVEIRKELKILHLACPHLQNFMIELKKQRSHLACPPGKHMSIKGTHDPSLQVGRLVLGFINVDSVFVEQLLLSFSLSSLQSIRIGNCNGRLSLPGVELTSLRECHIEDTDGLESLHIPSPHFQKATLTRCTGLTSVELEFPTDILISNCPELKNLQIAHTDAIKTFEISSFRNVVAGKDWDSIPNLGECSCIIKLELSGVDNVFIERLLSSPSPSPPFWSHLISNFKSTGSLTVPFPPSLKSFYISGVPGLKVLNIKSQHLTDLAIENCSQLTNVHIAHPTSLTRLELLFCPELGLITGVDWDALTNLTHLIFNPLPPPEELPECLLQRQALGHLKITDKSISRSMTTIILQAVGA